MLQDIYEQLIKRRLEPRWGGGEVHVNIDGRRFMLADRPGGVAVRTLAATAPMIFDNPEDALAALGLALDATG
jgi:hypothetical protein